MKTLENDEEEMKDLVRQSHDHAIMTAAQRKQAKLLEESMVNNFLNPCPADTSISQDKHKCHFFCIKFSIFSYPSIFTYVLGAQKNHLFEMVLLSTHKICFG